MTALLQVYQGQLVLFVLVLTRVGGLFMSAPLFGSRNVPLQVRAFVATGIALIIAPLYWSSGFAAPQSLVDLSLLLAREAALGLSIGLAVLLLMSGVQIAGQLIGQTAGVSLADVFDPNFDSTVPVFGQFLDVVTMAVFVAIGGHRQVMAAMLDTFRWRPPGARDLPESLVPLLTQVLSESFIVGLRTAAPVMVALLMTVLVMGLVSRTLPQLNILAVGFNLNCLVLLLVLAVTLGGIAGVVEEQADDMLRAIRDAMAARPAAE